MKTTYCLRCTKDVERESPRLCPACAKELGALFDEGEHVLERGNFDQACVDCGAFDRALLHGPGELTWCSECVETGRGA